MRPSAYSYTIVQLLKIIFLLRNDNKITYTKYRMELSNLENKNFV